MSITAGRFNAARQIVKSALDDLEREFPGDDVAALHVALASADLLAAVVSQRIWGAGPVPLDGDPKPNG